MRASSRACRFARSQLTRPQTSSARSYSVRVSQEHGPTSVSTVSDLLSIDRTLDVRVDGWIKNVRRSATVRFLDISDGSCRAPLQAVVDKHVFNSLPGVGAQFGAAVSLKGTWTPRAKPETAQPGETATFELSVKEMEILGESNAARKYATPESLRRIPHLRMRTPLNNNMLRIRSDVMGILSQFMEKQKFQQTHTPIVTTSDCEGAGETFRVEAGTPKDPFSKKPQYLTVSSQLYLEALAQALGNVWTLSPTFRAEKSDTSRHLSEFYMLEAELSFVDDMDEVMDFIQKLLGAVVGGLQQRSAWKELDDLRLHPKNPEEQQTVADLDSRDILQRRWNGLVHTSRWPRITYTKAIELLQEKGAGFEFPPTWGKGLQSEHERYLAESIGYDQASNSYLPVFITHYPREIKAFYMRQSQASPTQGSVFDCFDLIVPGLGELAGGSMREHRHGLLLENMGPDHRPGEGVLDWYEDLRRWGCPPHGGFGIGFDRLLSYLTGVKSIRDTVPFPRLYGHMHP
ncbi:Asparagine--tRNA ligase-like protein [Emericellopsis cladophorae]|uniref:asparagine--tRNA ligase n=1 Tax=Emericellopsis cladophorae TaxID=2686198 RepID=A0A9P9Y0L8_9HYPO|nr:Asparagine--tRNA ligase-like protein [Emericellopsis cladophorae]KAI6780764.1 Asparagine--tRNA ligase-like protein [Emericellopsis cladophorae]